LGKNVTDRKNIEKQRGEGTQRKKKTENRVGKKEEKKSI